MNALDLHRAIAAVAPIDGVSLGDLTDKSTWKAQYKPEATDQQKLAGQAVIDSFKLDDAPARRPVPKSLVLSRLSDAQLDKALAIMTNRQKERWRAPDKPDVFADDPETVALVAAVGANPEEVLAP